MKARLASFEDDAQIVTLLAACFGDEGPEMGGTPDTIETLAASRMAGHGLIVLECDGAIVGFVDVNPQFGAAFKLAVEPSCRSRGYGALLMQAAELLAIDSHWSEMLVGVMESKPHLLRYYAKLGYVDEGRREHMEIHAQFSGPPPVIIVLRKDLVGGAANGVA